MMRRTKDERKTAGKIIALFAFIFQIRMREADILTRMIWELWECRKIWV